MAPVVIILIIVLSMTAIVSYVLFMIWVVATRSLEHVKKAVRYSVSNDEFCEPEKGPCSLVVLDTLPYPTFPLGPIFSYTVARYAADLVVRVVRLEQKMDPAQTLTMPPGMVLDTTLSYQKKTIGFIGHKDGVYWIAFRGTSTDNEWKRDLEFSLTSTNTIQDRDTQRASMTGTGMCHTGFLDIYDDFEQIIYDMIAPGSTVVVTGHSLGAGLATLACLNLKATRTVTGYVFASPRVCSVVDTADMNGFFRVVNTADIIPSTPFSTMFNIKNHDKPYHYTHGGKAFYFTENRLSLTNSHLIPVYIKALDDQALNEN